LTSILSDEKNLTLPERVGMIGDISAFTSGYVPLGDAMALVPKFAHESSREVVTKTLQIVGNLDDHLVPEELKPKYRRYISDLYGQRAQELGWKDLASDNDDSRLLRPTMFSVVANRAQDPELIGTSRKLTLEWLSDHKAVDPDMLNAVILTAARHGDQALFDRFRAQAKKETDENLQGTLLFAMGSFPDPAIVKAALSIVLTDEFNSRQALQILFGASSPATRDLAYDFVKQNWDALVEKLPTDSGAFLPFVGGGYCDAEHRADIETFFRDRSTKYAGGPRTLQQVLEGVDLCIAYKNENQASVAEFLQKY
jgi:cytosol alanyl aminopeptidase